MKLLFSNRVTWLFLGLLIAYILTASGRIDSGDGVAIFQVSQSLIEHGTVTVPPPDPDLIAYDAQGRPLGRAADLGIEDGSSIRGRGNLYYTPYGIGHSLLALPLMALGYLLPGTALWRVEFVVTMLFNPLVSAATGVLVYLTGIRLALTEKQSLTLAFLYAFATMTWVYAKSFFSDPLIALCLLLAFYGLLTYRTEAQSRWLWLAGGALGLALLIKPASIINIPIFGLYLLWIIWPQPLLERLKPILWFSLPIGMGLLAVLLYNWFRFESPFDTGYRNIGWSFPFWLGLYGLIASPGKGYLLFNPVILLAIAGMRAFWRQHRPELIVILGVVVANILFLATYDHWHGGGSWGPRLLLPITPLLILPLGTLLEKIPQQGVKPLLVALVIVVSVLVQALGVSVHYGRYLQRIYTLSVEEYYQRVTFEWTYSPLLGQALELREVVGNLRSPDIRAQLSEQAFHNEESLWPERIPDALSANLPDFWFVYLSFIRAQRE